MEKVLTLEYITTPEESEHWRCHKHRNGSSHALRLTSHAKVIPTSSNNCRRVVLDVQHLKRKEQNPSPEKTPQTTLILGYQIAKEPAHTLARTWWNTEGCTSQSKGYSRYSTPSSKFREISFRKVKAVLESNEHSRWILSLRCFTTKLRSMYRWRSWQKQAVAWTR